MAGSERLDSRVYSENQIKEAKYINKSLGELNRVMESLKKKQNPTFRASKLTYLLEEYLRGNSKTIVIGNISPNRCHLADTRNTLRVLSHTVAKIEADTPKATQIINGKEFKCNFEHVADVEMLINEIGNTESEESSETD